MCNTGSDFDPCERKIFAAGATALKSCGRIGRNGASGSATNENDPFWGGFSGFGQAERAAEPPRGPRIESPAPPSEPPTALRPACGAPLPDPRSPQPVLAARDLATPPLAGGQQPINPLRKTDRLSCSVRPARSAPACPRWDSVRRVRSVRQSSGGNRPFPRIPPGTAPRRGGGLGRRRQAIGVLLVFVFSRLQEQQKGAY